MDVRKIDISSNTGRSLSPKHQNLGCLSEHLESYHRHSATYAQLRTTRTITTTTTTRNDEIPDDALVNNQNHFSSMPMEDYKFAFLNYILKKKRNNEISSTSKSRKPAACTSLWMSSARQKDNVVLCPGALWFHFSFQVCYWNYQHLL